MALDQTIALHKLMLVAPKRTAKEIQQDLWNLHGMHLGIETIRNNLKALGAIYNVKKEVGFNHEIYYWIPKGGRFDAEREYFTRSALR